MKLKKVSWNNSVSIKKKIHTLESLSEFCEQHRKKNTLVFTNGCFDILHTGHVTYLAEAKALGDILIVGINSDPSVKILKGPLRPIHAQADRAIVIAALESVDAVTIFDQKTPIQLIEKLKPHIHVKGGDYKKESLPEYPFVKKYGGDLKILPFHTGHSTSKSIEKAQLKNHAED